MGLFKFKQSSCYVKTKVAKIGNKDKIMRENGNAEIKHELL